MHANRVHEGDRERIMEPNVINSAVQVIAVSPGDITVVIALLACLCGCIAISLGMMARRNRDFVRHFPAETE